MRPAVPMAVTEEYYLLVYDNVQSGSSSTFQRMSCLHLGRRVSGGDKQQAEYVAVCLTYSSTMNMEAACSSMQSVNFCLPRYMMSHPKDGTQHHHQIFNKDLMQSGTTISTFGKRHCFHLHGLIPKMELAPSCKGGWLSSVRLIVTGHKTSQSNIHCHKNLNFHAINSSLHERICNVINYLMIHL